MATIDIITCDKIFTIKEAETIQKLFEQMQNLKDYFKERDEIIEGLFLGLLSKNHSIQIGPCGTGKSYLIESFTKGFKGFKFFGRQFTKFTNPEEVFGPYSLLELKKGNYKRVPKDKLPECHIAYIDEVFNANSSILNSLNSAMNERIFENSPIPLECLMGATNFTPEDSVLVAFFDRFLLRYITNDISEPSAFEAMLIQGEFSLDPSLYISKQEISALQNKVKMIDCSSIIPFITKLRESLKEESMEPSSRRFKWSLKALQARALLSGRKEVSEEDLFILRDILWTEKKDIPIVEQLIAKAINPAIARIRELLQQGKDIESRVKSKDSKDPNELAEIMESIEKLSNIRKEIEEILNRGSLSPKIELIAKKIMDQITSTGKKIQKDKLKIMF